MAPNLLLSKFVKDQAVAGYLVLSVQALGGKDLTGKSSSQKRFHCFPARLLNMASCGALGRGGGRVRCLGRGPLSRAQPPDFKW